MRSKADDRELASLWQTPHEEDARFASDLHTLVQTHATTTIHNEDEVEVGSIAKLDCLRLLVFDDIKCILWCHWIECRDKRDRTSDLVTVRSLSVI